MPAKPKNFIPDPDIVSTAELAGKLGISGARVRQLREDGVFARQENNKLSLAQCSAAYAEYKTRKSRGKEKAGDLEETKLRKLTAEADLAELKVSVQRGELVPIAGIRADGQSIGFAVRAALEKLNHELPPALAGRTAAEISVHLRRRIRDLLDDMADRADFFQPIENHEK
jgi:phage terminase Nu1 subunit (DNA packaging protein)